MDNTGTVIRNISREMDKLAGGVQSATQPLANMHDRILKLQTALGALAIGGLALSINAAADFDSQFREIATLIDDTGDGVDQFRMQIREYANTSTQSIEDINKSIYTALSAGIEYGDALKYIAQAEQLAVAGRADLYSTTKLLESVMNAYGASTDEAGRYSDVLFQTVRQGLTTIPELAQSLSQVSSMAGAAGVPIETVSAAIASLTAQGMPTSEAMTAIRGAIQSIINPTQQASNYAAELGIEFNASALASKGLEGVLLDVWEATDGNVDAVSQLFSNVRGLTGVLAMFGQDGGDRFLDNIGKMQDAAGVTADAFEKMVGDVSYANQQLANNVRLTFVAVGDELISEYGDMVSGISDIFKALQQSVQAGAFDDVFDVLREIAGDLTATFDNIARNLPEALNQMDFSRLARSIRDLADNTAGVLDAFFGQVDLDTPEGLAQAMQRIVNAGAALTEISSSIIESWQKWAGWLGSLVEGFGDLDSSTTETIGNFLQLGKVINVAAGFVSSFAGALDGMSVLLKVIAAQRLVNLITGLGSAATAMGGLGAATQAAIGSAAGKAGLIGLAYYAGHITGTLFNEHVPAVGKAAQSIYGWADRILDFTGKQEAANKEAESFANLVNAIADNIGDFTYDLGGLRDQLEGLGHDLSGLSDADVIRLSAEADILSFEEAMQIIRTRVPEKQKIKFEADIVEAKKELIELGHDVEGLTGEQILELRAIHDQVALSKTEQEITETTERIKGQTQNIPPYIINVSDDGSIEILENDLEYASRPRSVEIEPELSGLETDEFKAVMGVLDTMISNYHDTIQAKVEWQAKLEIAEVEANAKRVEAIMDGVSTSVETAGGVLESIFSNIGQMSEAGIWSYDIQRYIERQMDIQERGLEIQEKMSWAEMEFMEIRKRRMQSGEPLITVSGDGLQPHLEMIMFEILGAVQARASEEYQNFLLGVE
ncbi:phage tail tape measure protein [Desulfonatronovibrio hydrogenovorans]|uniref:phage tail tape measure protein n=1 Tax=Desulfonatronovibrio hydrogenovorans TaxID=53245 RepID=UPI001377D488|nr:phage tail tape measure protein [Desulfonatronovibrio hydrogenovorans]